MKYKFENSNKGRSGFFTFFFILVSITFKLVVISIRNYPTFENQCQ